MKSTAIDRALGGKEPSAWIQGKLARVTSSREFIPEVDGLRFLALIPVLALHSMTHFLIWRGVRDFTGDWTANRGEAIHLLGLGWFGVSIFFVISGFIVALPFARHTLQGTPKPDLRRYFLRRLTRIEPPYLISMTVMFAISFNYLPWLRHYIAGLFYLHGFLFGYRNPVNIVAWSLEVEVFFYLLAPWLTRVYRIRNRTDRWMLQLACIAGWTYLFQYKWTTFLPTRLSISLPGYLAFFLAGILLADLYASGKMQRTGRIAWDFAGFGGWIALVYQSGWDNSLTWAAPLMIAAIVAGGMKGRVLNRFLRWRWITVIGGMCYSVYLWHILLLVLLRSGVSVLIPRTLSDGPAALIFCVLTVPILIAASAPIFYFLEKPFMNGPGSRWIERRFGRVGLIRRNTGRDDYPISSGS